MTVGVQILDEDGTLLHEFPANLGKPLLYRLLTVAKFTGEDETEIILNGFVADFGKALAERASPRSTIDQGQVHNDLSRQAWTRLANVLRDNILSGRLGWPGWSAEEKHAFVSDVLFAPYRPTNEFIAEFIEETDWRLAQAKQALNQE
jgi:hypothetical protein